MGEKADRGLLEAMLHRATATAGAFTTPQDIGNVLWALATMGERMDGARVNLIDCLAGSTHPRSFVGVSQSQFFTDLVNFWR